MIGPLIDGAIKRRKVVLGVTLVAAIFGLFAYLAMPREAQPNIDARDPQAALSVGDRLGGTDRRRAPIRCFSRWDFRTELDDTASADAISVQTALTSVQPVPIVSSRTRFNFIRSSQREIAT